MSTLIEPTPETVKSAAQLVKDTYKGKVHPDWCPGCGDFSVLSALQTALFELGLQPHQVVVISGIGCSSNLPGFINTYGMHTLHGRSLAVGTGVKLGNHDLKVICVGGDGDGYGIGGNHFVHTMRRNVDLTYIVMDNQIYGLTTGQTSPTSAKGMKTKSTPHGSVENAINPMPMAMVGGATYVARGFSGKQKHLVEILKGAIQHRGFSLVDVFSPCVTYNKDNTYQWFNPRVKILEEQGYEPTDFQKAMEKGYQWGDEIPIGVIWKRTDLPALEDLEPVLQDGNGPLGFRKLGITDEQAEVLIKELM
ncbi:MAG TPA: 2-oxoacid:ferredoxin oxidoreductase subunit beta [Verrucomicrobiae bacterium]|nr:2-oxoacid:ferredoxin oxidoreductase subunit beta [Verrucomicrobiae bacterium]